MENEFKIIPAEKGWSCVLPYYGDTHYEDHCDYVEVLAWAIRFSLDSKGIPSREIYPICAYDTFFSTDIWHVRSPSGLIQGTDGLYENEQNLIIELKRCDKAREKFEEKMKILRDKNGKN